MNFIAHIVELIKENRFAVSFVAVIFVAFVLSFSFLVKSVNANPSFFVRNNTSSAISVASSVATSSQIAWMTAGAGTSTRVLNGSIGSTQALDSATLILHRLGASANTKTRIDFEYSMDCDATAPDWYALASTTQSVQTGSHGIIWAFASTSPGGTGAAIDRDTLAITVPVPARCVRAILSVPIGAASSSIYGEFVGKRQSF